MLPVVVYAAERRVCASGKSDFWDYATLLEAAVLNGDKARAEGALKEALPLVRRPLGTGDDGPQPPPDPRGPPATRPLRRLG